jgi:hypothetical protein
VTDIRQILSQLAAQEGQLLDTQFLAPCVRGGKGADKDKWDDLSVSTAAAQL